MSRIEALLYWMAQHGWVSGLLVLSLQIALATLIAWCVCSQCRWQAATRHSLWTLLVCMLLALAPIHAFVGGWPIGIRAPEPVTMVVSNTTAESNPMVGPETVPPAVSSSVHTATEPPIPAASAPNALEVTKANDARWPASDADLSPRSTVHLDVHLDAREAIDEDAIGQEEKTSAEIGSMVQPVRQAWSLGQANWFFILLAVYVLGIGWMISRLVIGSWRLHSWEVNGRELSATSQQLLTEVVQRLQLRRDLHCVICEPLTTPLLCGIRNPTIMVPGDFELWTEQEQRIVFLHEATHAKRGDLAWQLATKLMRALYWFHPACCIIDRQVAVARELATDEMVVSLGISAKHYAHHLLSILERARAKEMRTDRHRDLASSCAVPMSAVSDMEDRLKHILQRVHPSFGQRGIAYWTVIGLLAFLMVATTVRMQWAEIAQANTPPSGIASDGASSESNAPLAADESDLFERLRDCELYQVDGGEFSHELTVRGKVVTPDGKPVAGAIVVLKEHTLGRLVSDAKTQLRNLPPDVTRHRDVFGRTVTDEEGRYEFVGIRTPSFSRLITLQEWRGNVVAAHPSLGFGWLDLMELQPQKGQPLTGESKPSIEVDLIKQGTLVLQPNLVLRPSTTIRGVLVDPDGTPIPDASLWVEDLSNPSEMPEKGEGLLLALSQLAARVQTDREGRFVLPNLPQSCRVSLFLYHPKWYLEHGEVMTNQESNLTADKEFDASGTESIVVEATPVQTIEGIVVDNEGLPVLGARVWHSRRVDGKWNTCDSNHDGRFQLRMRSIQSEMPAKTEMTLDVVPFTGDCLPLQGISLSDEIVAGTRPLRITLQRGVLASGQVTTATGEPAEGIWFYIRNTGERGFTDRSGKYRFVLPKGEYEVLFVRESLAYASPNRFDGRSDRAIAWQTTRKLDLVDAPLEIAPVVVEDIKKLRVSATLPNGMAASAATLQLHDRVNLLRDLISPNRNPSDDKPWMATTEPITTDSQGMASLTLSIPPTAEARVEATLFQEGILYEGTALVRELEHAPLKLTPANKWQVKGRVLWNQQPIEGAIVEITQSEMNPLHPDRLTYGNGIKAKTDANGKYLAYVDPDRSYAVTVNSIPGVEGRSEYVLMPANKVSEGVYQVADFQFAQGTEEVAGVVVDESGKPLSGIQVSVAPSPTVLPMNWSGHAESSQPITNERGEFSLRKIPKGIKLSIWITEHTAKGEGTTITRDVNAGDTDLRIVFQSKPVSELQKLSPKTTRPLGVAKP